jgi:4-carboxymuconolactone decarboxylase
MPRDRYGRLPWYEPEEFDADQRTFYEYVAHGPRMPATTALPLVDPVGGRMYGPFNAFLSTPVLGKALHECGKILRYQTGFTARGREVAILELSALRRCGIEWYAHEPIGRRAGLTDEELTAIRTGAPAPTLDESETLIRQVTQSLLRSRDIDDALYAAAAAALGDKVLMEYVMLVCYFDMLATTMTVFRAELPAGKEPPFG